MAAFVVNSTLDAVATHPGDGAAVDAFGNTTLRAAVMEGNALAGDDSIKLPAGTYALSIPEYYGDASGDLDINDNLTIIGAGAEATVIDAAGIDRVLGGEFCSPADSGQPWIKKQRRVSKLSCSDRSIMELCQNNLTTR